MYYRRRCPQHMITWSDLSFKRLISDSTRLLCALLTVLFTTAQPRVNGTLYSYP